MRAFGKGVTDLERAGSGNQLFDKGIVNRRMNDQPRGRRAFLPRATKGRPCGMDDGKVKVGIIHDQHRVLRAHLHLNLGHVLDCGQGNPATDRNRAGKADRINTPVFDQLLAHIAARTGYEVEKALRNVLTRDDLGQRHGTGGRQVGGFPHHGVAVGESRGDLPRRGRHRKVPRADDRHHTNRLAKHVNLDAGAHALGVVADDAQGLGGVVGEKLAGAEDLALALGQGLALLAGEKPADLGGAGDQFGPDGHQHIVPLLDARRPPDRLRGASGCNRVVDLGGAGLGVVADHVGQVRGVAIFDGGRPVLPAASNMIAGFKGHGHFFHLRPQVRARASNTRCRVKTPARSPLACGTVIGASLEASAA